MSLIELQRALKEQTLPQLFAQLRANGVCPSHIVDFQTGDTLLHWMCQHAPLELLYQEMVHFRPYFHVVNYQRLTCFGQAISQRRQALIHCLLHFDQDGVFLLEQILYFQYHQNVYFQTSALMMSALDYQAIFDFKKTFLSTQAITQRVALIDRMNTQFSFTTPIDEHGNTIIHFIVAHGELIDIQHMLKLSTLKQINCPNDHGQTALMQAAMASKQCIVSLLMSFGADDTILDQQHHCARYYNQQTSKHIAFIAYNPIDLLTPIDKLLKNLKTQNGLTALFAYLNHKKLTLTMPINANDDTILHYLVVACPLTLYPDLLKHIKNETLALAIVNVKGETPLHTLIKRQSYAKANTLIHLGSGLTQRDCSGLTAIEYAQLSRINLSGRSADDYLYTDKLAEKLNLNLNWRSVVKEFRSRGFRLDEPINDNNDTMLHLLIDQIPYHHFRWLLTVHPDCDLTRSNKTNGTLLEKSLHQNRFYITAFLHKQQLNKDPNFTLPAIPEVVEYQAFTARTKFPSVFQYFMFQFTQEEVAKLESNAKIAYCYTIFLDYIRSRKIQYHGTRRSGAFFLDCEYDQAYTVNCYDLASAFGYLLDSIGINAVSIHRYNNIKSRPFSDKGNIQGDFICFDRESHQKYFVKDDYFCFDAHYVLKANNRFYDPTFCCHYDQENDVFPTPLVYRKTTSVTIDYIPLQADHLRSPFNLIFMAALNKHFGSQQYTYFQEGTTLLMKGHNQFIQLRHQYQSLITFSENIAPDMITLILQIWTQSLPIAGLKMDVIAPNQHERDFILSQFQQPISRMALNCRIK